MNGISNFSTHKIICTYITMIIKMYSIAPIRQILYVYIYVYAKNNQINSKMGALSVHCDVNIVITVGN